MNNIEAMFKGFIQKEPVSPTNQLTAAAGEIATELCIKFSPTYFKAIDTISTNPMLVAIAKENEYLKSIISGNAETEIRQLQTKCAELQNKVQELEKDKDRLDRLEKLSTFAIWQGTFADTDHNILLGRAGAPIVTLSTMDADGSEVVEEIGRGDTLRIAIDSVTST